MSVLTTQTSILHTELGTLLSSLVHFTPTLTKLAQEHQVMGLQSWQLWLHTVPEAPYNVSTATSFAVSVDLWLIITNGFYHFCIKLCSTAVSLHQWFSVPWSSFFISLFNKVFIAFKSFGWKSYDRINEIKYL